MTPLSQVPITPSLVNYTPRAVREVAAFQLLQLTLLQAMHQAHNLTCKYNKAFFAALISTVGNGRRFKLVCRLLFYV